MRTSDAGNGPRPASCASDRPVRIAVWVRGRSPSAASASIAAGGAAASHELTTIGASVPSKSEATSSTSLWASSSIAAWRSFVIGCVLASALEPGEERLAPAVHVVVGHDLLERPHTVLLLHGVHV